MCTIFLKSASLDDIASLVLSKFTNITGMNLIAIETIVAIFLGFMPKIFNGFESLSSAATRLEIEVVNVKINDMKMNIKKRHIAVKPCLSWFGENRIYINNKNAKMK